MQCDFYQPYGFVLILFVLTSCSQGKSAEPPAANAIPIKTGKVRHVQEREFVSVSGTVTSPDAPVQVSFLVSGKVIQVVPREGDYVKKGQLLAVIDPIDYKLSLQAASAQVGQAKVALDRSKDEYARMKFLYESRSLAENDFEKFKAAYLSAKQQVDQAIANQKLAQKRLSDASLYAPAAGFISKRSIEPGQTASPGSPVFEIVKLDPVEINVGVPETDIHLVRIGQTAVCHDPGSADGIVRGESAGHQRLGGPQYPNVHDADRGSQSSPYPPGRDGCRGQDSGRQDRST